MNKSLWKAMFIAGMLVIMATPSYANDRGMYVCGSPVIANNLWTDLQAARNAGAPLTPSVVASIAGKNTCSLMLGDNLKPVDFVAGQLAISNGQSRGWAAPQLFIFYANATPK